MQKRLKKESVVACEKFFYARKEAAYALAVSVRKIDYFISDQKLRTRRIGRRVVIPSEDVKRLADEIMRSDMAVKP
jgi:excisionase family DNA binding protein